MKLNETYYVPVMSGTPDVLWGCASTHRDCVMNYAKAQNVTALVGRIAKVRIVEVVEEPVAEQPPTPPKGYRLLPKSDGHTVEYGEKMTDGECAWLIADNRVAGDGLWYCRPIAKPAPAEPHAKYRQEQLPDSTVVKQPAEPGPQDHEWPYWLGILMEEVGELAKRVIEDDAPEYIEKEAIQVAAVALAIAQRAHFGGAV